MTITPEDIGLEKITMDANPEPGDLNPASDFAARSLIAELRQSCIDLVVIARAKWGNLDPDANAIMDKASKLIAQTEPLTKK